MDRDKERQREGDLVSYKDTNHTGSGPTLMTCLPHSCHSRASPHMPGTARTQSRHCYPRVPLPPRAPPTMYAVF